MCFSDCCLQEASLLAASAASSMGLWDFGGLESRCIQACCPLFTCLGITVKELLCKSTCLHCAPVKGKKNPCVKSWLSDTNSTSYQEVCLQLQLGLMLQHHEQSHYIWFALKLLLCLCIFPSSLLRRDKSKTKPPTKHMHSLGCGGSSWLWSFITQREAKISIRI